MKKMIEKISKGLHLDEEEMTIAAKWLFSDEASERQIAKFLQKLTQKGETAEEVAALATVMRSYATNLSVPQDQYLDNCGTGGDGANTFNISTTSAFVLASAGLKVAKHGNRKVSSRSGSHDVLEALGIHSQFNEQQVIELLQVTGITFLYAPQVHPKLKRIGRVRQQLGTPTIFNLVGPLTNPVSLHAQFTGVNRPDFLMDYATVLHRLGRTRAVVVSGPNGLDEASLAGQNSFVLLDRGDFIPFTLTAEDVGLSYAPLAAIKGGTPAENAKIVLSVLQGKRGPQLDTVLLNAGIGFFAAGQVTTIREGISRAKEQIASGKAFQKFEEVVAYSQQIQQGVSV